MKNFYVNPHFESHIMDDHLLPFIFHTDKITANVFYPNWHSNIEILYCIKGKGQIKCDANIYDFKPDDIFIVNSTLFHSVKSDSEVEYHCLIIDNDFCASNGIPADSLKFREMIRDTSVNDAYLEFINEYQKNSHANPMCKIAAVRRAILSLLIVLCENYIEDINTAEGENDPSAERIKEIILYVRKNFSAQLTLDDLARLAGINKFYLSREFKRLTGQTLFEYINIVRCNEAKKMISDGMSVSSAAMFCGFENLSYFTRTYKKYIGALPSQHL